MKAQRKVTPREVNSDRAIGLINGGMSQGVVARQYNVSRKSVNHYWKRHLNGESLKDKGGRPDCSRHCKNRFLESQKGKRGQSVHCGN